MDCLHGLADGDSFTWDFWEEDDDALIFELTAQAKVISVNLDCSICFSYSVVPDAYALQHGNWSSYLTDGSREVTKCMDEINFMYAIGRGAEVPTTQAPTTTPDQCGLPVSVGGAFNYRRVEVDDDGSYFQFESQAKVISISSNCDVTFGFSTTPIGQTLSQGNWTSLQPSGSRDGETTMPKTEFLWMLNN